MIATAPLAAGSSEYTRDGRGVSAPHTLHFDLSWIHLRGRPSEASTLGAEVIGGEPGLMKILMSALACEPGKGSELEVGFRGLLAAASRHEVWILTNAASIPAIRRAIDGHADADRIHLEGIQFDVDEQLYTELTVPGFHWYYDRWQRRAAIRAVELDRRIDFDVVHHVTLAAYWTRTGVAAVRKPLVWGPVGGGVNPPLSLLPELGWRGLVEDAGRVVGRLLLARFGPAHRAQREARVIFAQNDETLRRMRNSDRTSVMTNATVVDLEDFRSAGTRTQDVLVVGRLVPWKGPILAVRSFRYVRHTGARLIFCGDGPERKRIQRAAKRWGIADRVHIEGWLPREELLGRLATAGALFHPALHEEAGLCVAEGLALGTPAVCLDRGGPPEILREWPDTASTAVPVADPQTTARRLAFAIDRYLDDPPPVPAVPQGSTTSFDQEVLIAYETAAQTQRVRGRPPVWAFPRGKPQLFSDSARGLSRGVLVYSFGRRLPPVTQRGVALQLRLPGLRRLVAERRPPAEPVCGWDRWNAIEETLRTRGPRAAVRWVQFSSQWGKQRSSFLGLDAQGVARSFLSVEPVGKHSRPPLRSVSSFRVPVCVGSFRHKDWWVRQYEPLPQFHRPAKWDLGRIRQVAADASRALDVAGRPAEVPRHWRPIHGDLVPWNLREDSHGQLWLLDWEDAGWGPPLADLLRYIVAYHSLSRKSPERIASLVRAALEAEPAHALREAARFWANHPNVRPVRGFRGVSRANAKDAARGAREFATFHALASPKRQERAPSHFGR